jgi:hypothetical protein
MMSARTTAHIVGTALVLLVSGSLTARTSTISPQQSAAKKCAPTSAQISFGSAIQGKKEPVEAHLISFEDGVLVSTPMQTSVDTAATFGYPGERSISDISSTSEGAWQSSLLMRVRKTGKVPTGFGDGTPVEPSDITPDASSGKYVVVTEEELTTVPFTIACSGEKTLAGDVAAFADTGSYSTLTQCGTTPEGLSPEIVALMGPACTQE